MKNNFKKYPLGIGIGLGGFDQIDFGADGPFAALNETSLSPQNALEKWAVDLTTMAKQGQLKPVIGRHQEIKQVLEVLMQLDKNNPVLVGDPGVGKTAIVEAIAIAIANGDVPDQFKDRKLYSVNVANLKAGTGAHGQMEQRVKLIIDAATQDANIILFIDEFHLLVGTGKHSTDASIDVANMLKPALARGQIKLIGATTHEEYQKYIQSDKAFLRRLQIINISEATPAQTLAILRGLKSSYEKHHNLLIDDQALVKAVAWSQRYLPQLHFPDKAITLIDRAAAALNLENHSEPMKMKLLKDEIENLKLMQSSLIINNQVAEQIEEIKQAIKDCQDQYEQQKADWIALKDKQSANANQQEKLLKLYDDLKMSDDKNEQIISKIKKLTASFEPELKNQLYLNADAIAKAISDQTKIDVNVINQGDLDRLQTLKTSLEKDVIGQNNAIEQLYNVLVKAYLQTNDHQCPLASFLWLGRSGVGKTLLAKTLASALFGDPKNFIRLDMSEYRDPMALTKLIGASAGYVGYHDRNQFSDLVNDRPYSVILIDEIEEAHPSVWSLFLQILDEGRLKDNHGKIVDFRNTIIIMTSNVGADQVNRFENEHQLRNLIKANFPNKFLNRIDEVISFNNLNAKMVNDVILLKMQNFQKMLVENQVLNHINITYDQDFIKNLTNDVLNHDQEGLRLVTRVFNNDLNHLVTNYYLNHQKETNVQLEIAFAKQKIKIIRVNEQPYQDDLVLN